MRLESRRRALAPAAALALAAIAAAGCAGDTGFSEPRARAHVRMLAGTLGSRPAGSEANRRAREYVAGELRRAGFDVRIQEADASRPEFGLTARVANVLAVRPGTSPDAVAVLCHYDSQPDSPGGADDGLGVAVALEAARVLAGRASPRWTLAVVLTDAEELGLLGAAALVDDPLLRHVRAYINLEAVGTTGPSLLFQAGPGNAWLVHAWAKAAPRPAGNSIAGEVYRRLPNDTDFSVISRLGIPGLNFAPVGSSEAYHTSRDTEANLSPRTLQQTGDTVVALVRALDGVDVRQRAPGDQATYFDLAERVAVVYGPRETALVAWLAVAFGALAWLEMLIASRRGAGVARVLLAFAWTLVAVALAGLAMTAAAWLLRSVTGWLHPWYAGPGWFAAMLLAVGLSAWWVAAWLASRLPDRWRGCATPACTWAVALPAWIGLTAWLHLSAPAAGFVLAWPLLVAGVGLAVAPARPGAIRFVSLAVLVVAALLTLQTAVRLLLFASPAFGRLPVVMPLAVYPALILAFAVPIVPALAAAAPDRLRRVAGSAGAGLALALGATGLFAVAWAGAGYSPARPQLRMARYVNAELPGGGTAEFWEVGGNEPRPHADLLPGEPGAGRWRAVDGAPPVDPSPGRLPRAFVSRVEARAVAPFPGVVRASLERQDDGRARLSVRVTPDSPGAAVALVLPPGLQPEVSSFPGRIVDGRWRATYVAPPPPGVEFLLTLRAARPGDLGAARVAIVERGLPGGAGWQRLPPWLPAERDAWSARSMFLSSLGLEASR